MTKEEVTRIIMAHNHIVEVLGERFLEETDNVLMIDNDTVSLLTLDRWDGYWCEHEIDMDELVALLNKEV